MRATSARRKEPNRKVYRGTESAAPERKRHDYAGTGESFICAECGARVAAVRPKHAFGGGKNKPGDTCAGYAGFGVRK